MPPLPFRKLLSMIIASAIGAALIVFFYLSGAFGTYGLMVLCPLWGIIVGVVHGLLWPSDS